MLKKFLIISLFFTLSSSNAADVSNFFSNLIPGEGLTEASIQINEDDNPDIEILAVRDIKSQEFSNLFTQFSLHTQESNGHDRFIGNFGFGYRKLSIDKSNFQFLKLVCVASPESNPLVRYLESVIVVFSISNFSFVI